MSHGASPLAAFHRAGDRSRLPATADAELQLRPALFAACQDPDRLRADFPLVLTPTPGADPWIISLADAVDGLLRETTRPGPADEEARRKVLAVEAAIRRHLREDQQGALAQLWADAWRALRAGDNPPPGEAPGAPPVAGELIGCDRQTAGRVVRRAWLESEGGKGRRLHARTEFLAQKLSDILLADHAHSTAARGPEQLARAVGGGDRTAFDFRAMARLLQTAPAADPLPERRRQRIQAAIATLRSQRFVTADGLPRSDDLLRFEFDDCAAALAALRARLPEMRALVAAIGIAELEIDNHYDEARHDRLFEQFTEDRLGPGDFELFPSYLVCIEDLDAARRATALDLLDSGLPFKIVAQYTDILNDLSPAGGQLSFGKRGQHLARMALGLDQVFVLQAPNAYLYRMRESILAAMSASQPALISVYAGPDYLASAAACEARAFPCFVHDPAAGAGQAERMSVQCNPQRAEDWPRHRLDYETAGHDRQAADTAFTVVDFVAADPRFAGCFASIDASFIAGADAADAENRLVPVDEYLRLSARERARALPFVLLIDQGNTLRRAVVDEKLIEAAQRCLGAWRSLQELGGIGNSHALLALRQAQQAWDAEKAGIQAQAQARPAQQAPGPAPQSAHAPALATPAAVEPAATETAEAAPVSDDPWIETARCTTCNECTQLNDRMFAYNENKQAYVRDPDAGTYRELVQAAETCQVAIIHPGKPRNPNEPGLEELLKRAEPFL
jgi:hypothetical protein